MLGGGECGKTTIFKQIQIIHGVGFGAEATAWIGAVHACPLRAVKTLLAAVSAKGLRLLPENESRRDALLASMQPAFMESYRLNVETVRAIQAVMMDPSVKKLLEAPYDLNLEDNALYFLDILDELVAPDYAPTTEHILKLRDPTRTIHTRHFRVGKAQLRVMDVGGRSDASGQSGTSLKISPRSSLSALSQSTIRSCARTYGRIGLRCNDN